jgi:hypothetical protein
MRIVCSVSLSVLGLLPIVACARQQAPARAAKVTTVSAHTEAGRTVLSWTNAGGVSQSIAVTRDTTVHPATEPSGAAVVGEIPDSALVIIDSYPSIPGGMSYCQSGAERFLRVLSISGAQPVETYRVKLASCLGNIELGADSTAWDAGSAQLHINWLIGPGAAHAAESKTLRIRGDGHVH